MSDETLTGEEILDQVIDRIAGIIIDPNILTRDSLRSIQEKLHNSRRAYTEQIDNLIDERDTAEDNAASAEDERDDLDSIIADLENQIADLKND